MTQTNMYKKNRGQIIKFWRIDRNAVSRTRIYF